MKNYVIFSLEFHILFLLKLWILNPEENKRFFKLMIIVNDLISDDFYTL